MDINSIPRHNRCFMILAMLLVLCMSLHVQSFGKDYVMTVKSMEERPYTKTNTWNGCCIFDVGHTTRFMPWRCADEESVLAACMALQYVRYVQKGDNSKEYCTERINEKTIRIDFNQFAPPMGKTSVINGILLSAMSISVQPFQVINTNSRSVLQCVLVCFAHEGAFCFAVYVNMNQGKVSLDFHEVALDGYTLIAHESRYPYLTPQECEIQKKVYVEYFRESNSGNVR